MQVITKVAVSTALIFSMGVSAVDYQVKPLDRALINEERIAYWLKKRGEITATDSLVQQQEKVQAYIAKFEANNTKVDYLPKNYQVNSLKAKAQKYSIQKSSASDVHNKVNVLAILIDFPDLPYNKNRLNSRDTDMFYSDYSVGHYNDLLFSETGFSGPDGENLMSANQYYTLESGESFTFDGNVFGWYRAKNDADYYGGNNKDDNDSNAPALIVEAIEAAVAQGNVDLRDYDKKDPRDLDNDGNFNEPDGEIDHVLVIHSSVGEEAGGGVLGEDAIWAHRWAVPAADSAISGSTIKVRNYTVQPIDSGAGVVVHEFGHDLGLPDEYDLNATDIGSPVAMWSVMSGGSWLGEIRGTEPNVFSPYARDQLQQSLGGNWINQRVITQKELKNNLIDLALTQASNHNDAINQVKVELPHEKLFVGAPQQGSYQAIAQHQDRTHFRYSKELTLSDESAISLSMWARWEIEADYDYVQISIDGQPLSNKYTQATTPEHVGVTNIITGALDNSPWTELVFDLSSYRNQTVTLSVDYITDPYEGGFGFAMDNIALINGDKRQLIDDFEQGTIDQPAAKVAFARSTAYLGDMPDTFYYIQLRTNTKLDSALAEPGYEPGVLLWYANQAYTDNNSSEHPGMGFISVVDADQAFINPGDSDKQIRDAAFSLYPQNTYSGDSQLDAISEFSDKNDYSNPRQPQSGTILPNWGITMQVTEQAIDSDTATIVLSRAPIVLASDILAVRNGLDVSFEHQTTSSYQTASVAWSFGDGNTSTLPTPTHTYSNAGTYMVTLVLTDASGAQVTASKEIVTAQALNVDVTASVNKLSVQLAADVTGGIAPYTYAWDLGDESSSTLATLTHAYDKAGHYQVILTITDAIGQTKEVNVDVTTDSDMQVDFDYEVKGLRINLTGHVTDAIGDVSVRWEFGNRITSTGASTSYTYPQAGTYNVVMTATDETGAVKTMTQEITVEEGKSATKKSGGSMSLWLLALLAVFGVRKISLTNAK